MNTFAAVVLLLAGGTGNPYDGYRIDPYPPLEEVDEAKDSLRTPSFESNEESAAGGLVSLNLTFGINVGDDFDAFGTVDVEQENVFVGAVGLWFHVGEKVAVEVRLAWLAKTKLETDALGELEEADSIEGSASLVMLLPTPGPVKIFVTAGWGVKRWDGEASLDGEVDTLAQGGGGVLIGLGNFDLIIEARAVLIDMEGATEDPINFHGSVGISVGL